jgi:hypothetical protein
LNSCVAMNPPPCPAPAAAPPAAAAAPLPLMFSSPSITACSRSSAMTLARTGLGNLANASSCLLLGSSLIWMAIDSTRSAGTSS